MQTSVAALADYRDWLGLLRDGSGQETLVCAFHPLTSRECQLSVYQDILKHRFGRELVLHPKYEVVWRNRLGSLQPGGLSQIPLLLTNRGVEVWSAQGRQSVRVACRWRHNDGERVALMPVFCALPKDVSPGETIEMSLAVQPPAEDGTYQCLVSLHQEGTGWFDDWHAHDSQAITIRVTNSFGPGAFPP